MIYILTILRIILALLIVYAIFLMINKCATRSEKKTFWKCHMNSADFILPFEKFKSMYYISPEKYRLFDTQTRYYKDEYSWTNIGFSYKDYKKYLEFIEELEADKKYTKALHAKREFLSSVQDDIESYKVEAKREIEEKQVEIQESACSSWKQFWNTFKAGEFRNE